MSWGAQNRSKDAKTPSASRGMSKNPELGCCPVQSPAISNPGAMIPISYVTCAMKYKHLAEGLGGHRRARSSWGNY